MQYEEILLEVLRIMEATSVAEIETLLEIRPALNAHVHQVILKKWRADLIDEWIQIEPTSNTMPEADFF